MTQRVSQGRRFLCRIGWHYLKADHLNRADRCTECGKEWKLHVVPIPHWLAKLLAPWR